MSKEILYWKSYAKRKDCWVVLQLVLMVLLQYQHTYYLWPSPPNELCNPNQAPTMQSVLSTSITADKLLYQLKCLMKLWKCQRKCEWNQCWVNATESKPAKLIYELKWFVRVMGFEL
ncbi:hypothetical protein IFM89_024096 [Coptis chinensis]|uniref:Uncharacterized protein n=1 Tax=Coptis chinensis TaxID=261450 RepID=A0A835IFA9_9MAGN|nr:hypothetical protein IFM89_024096 [Coptis chinensis]